MWAGALHRWQLGLESQSRYNSRGTSRLGASVSASVKWVRELVAGDGLYGTFPFYTGVVGLD